MPSSSFFRILKTASSEVSNRTLFKRRFTCYIPDFCFIFIYTTLFFLSGALDIFFTLYLYLYGENPVAGGIYLVTIILPGIFQYLSDIDTDCLPNLRINKAFSFILSIIGFDAAINSFRACGDLIMRPSKTCAKPLKYFTFPFFRIQKDNLYSIKIYCFINSALKNLPRLFILPILLLQKNIDVFAAYVAMVLIVLNMAVFSLTVAITFPLRSTPRVFTSSICVVFSAFNKFMATMSACSVVLVIFATVYKSIHFYALLVPLFRCITWGWPCWRVLSCQNVPLTKFNFFVYFVFLTFFSSFIYIHPFEGIGKLNYYLFYFLDFLEEIIVIYMFTNVSVNSVTGYFSFRVVMIGFLSSFGLINLLHKYKDEKTKQGCVSDISITSENQENERNLDEKEKDNAPANITIATNNTDREKSGTEII